MVIGEPAQMAEVAAEVVVLHQGRVELVPLVPPQLEVTAETQTSKVRLLATLLEAVVVVAATQLNTALRFLGIIPNMAAEAEAVVGQAMPFQQGLAEVPYLVQAEAAEVEPLLVVPLVVRGVHIPLAVAVQAAAVLVMARLEAIILSVAAMAAAAEVAAHLVTKLAKEGLAVSLAAAEAAEVLIGRMVRAVVMGVQADAAKLGFGRIR